MRASPASHRHLRCGGVVLSALAKPAEWRTSLELLDQMRKSGITPTPTTLNVVASACAEAGRWDQVVELYAEINKQQLADQPEGKGEPRHAQPAS
jgi:pentatricopeptide repeat protein